MLPLLVACGPRQTTPQRSPAPLTTSTPAPAAPAAPAAPTTPTAPKPAGPPPGPPPVVISDSPPAAGDIGTSGYASVMASAPDGQWLLVCQARKDTDKDGKLGVSFGHHGELFGDDPEPYLIRGAGPGESLGEVAGVDPARRYIVVVRGKAMELLDVTTNQRVVLRGADTRYEAGLFDGARVAFDAEGQHLVYARPGAKRKIVLRVLATGVEREITASRGELRNVELADGWVVAHVFHTIPGQVGTHHVGRSGPAHTVGGRRCRSDYPLPPHVNERHYAPLAGGVATPRADVVATFGADLIVRAKDGALAIEQAGTLAPITAASCKGRVIARSAALRSILVGCEGAGDSAELQLWKQGVLRTLDVKMTNTTEDGFASPLARAEHELGSSSRFVRIPSGTAQVLIDLETGKRLELGERYVVATHDTKVLLHRREGAFTIHDLATGTSYQLPGTPPDMMIEAQRGRLFAAGPRGAGTEPGMLVDLDAWTVLGTFPGPALAVSTTGWVLQPSPLPSFSAGLSESSWGPLRWVRPTR